jgi:hypothetical protein
VPAGHLVRGADVRRLPALLDSLRLRGRGMIERWVFEHPFLTTIIFLVMLETLSRIFGRSDD